MTSQYEVEHNVSEEEERALGHRRINMASFWRIVNDVIGDDPSGAGQNNPHAVPTPYTTVSVFRLVQEQLNALRSATSGRSAGQAPPSDDEGTPGTSRSEFGSPATDGTRSTDHDRFLENLISLLDQDIQSPPPTLQGASQSYLDELDRVPRKSLKADDECPICKIPYLEDKYCLVVEIPCNGRHRFDLECVGPWLRSKGTCPLCRQNLVEPNFKDLPDLVAPSDDEEDDTDMMFA